MSYQDLESRGLRLLEAEKSWSDDLDSSGPEFKYRYFTVSTMGLNWDDLPKIRGFDHGSVRRNGIFVVHQATAFTEEYRPISLKLWGLSFEILSTRTHPNQLSFLLKLYSKSSLTEDLSWGHQLMIRENEYPVMRSYQLTERGLYEKFGEANERRILLFEDLLNQCSRLPRER